MSTTLGERHPSDASQVSLRLENEWALLSEQYLPIAPADEFWRSSRSREAAEPPQGWKLHISATILSAPELLRRIGPLLAECGVLFKAPSSLAGVSALNCGLAFGFSQVGKVITVYPRSNEQAAELAPKLYRLTDGLTGPAIPYDRRYAADGVVYYRYGAFTYLVDPASNRPALATPTGDLVPDRRDRPSVAPAWAPDPFGSTPRIPQPQSALRHVRAFGAISQRGKGGVYRAVDVRATPVRFCVLKEGRMWGETSWDGRDGRWRVRHEADVLRALAAAAIPVPAVFEYFEAERNAYISMEDLEGEPLAAWSNRRRRRPWRNRLAEALQIGAQLAALLDRIHAAGWLWRDCKPANIIVRNGTLRLIDFEGACRVDQPDSCPWGTPGYTRPGGNGMRAAAGPDDDLYGFGATLYHLLAERRPSPVQPPALDSLRRYIPEEVRTTVRHLLSGTERRTLGRIAKELAAAGLAVGEPAPPLASVRMS